MLMYNLGLAGLALLQFIQKQTQIKQYWPETINTHDHERSCDLTANIIS